MSLRGLGKNLKQLLHLHNEGEGSGHNDPYHHNFPTVKWQLDDYLPKFPERKPIMETVHSRVIEISPLVTEKETKALIALAKKAGFKSVDWEYSKDYRDCQRVVVKAPDVTAELWRRLQSAITPNEFVNVKAMVDLLTEERISILLLTARSVRMDSIMRDAGSLMESMSALGLSGILRGATLRRIRMEPLFWMTILGASTPSRST